MTKNGNNFKSQMKYKKSISSLLLICLIFSSLGQNYLFARTPRINNQQLRPPQQTISLDYQPEIKTIKPVIAEYRKPLIIGLIVSFFALTGTTGGAAAVTATTVLGAPIIHWLAAGVISLILVNNLLLFLANKIKLNIEKYWWLIPIKISWDWLIGFAVISWINSGILGWRTSMLFTITMYGMVLLHELTHVFVGNGIRTARLFKEMQMFIFGAIASIDEKRYIDAKTEFFFSIAGPLMSLILFMMFTIIGNRVDDQMLITLGKFNLIVFMINFLPVYPLDGGRAIKACLRMMPSNKNMDNVFADYRATEQALKLGEITRRLLIILGIVWYYYVPQAIGTIIVLLSVPIVISWLLSKLEKNELRERILRLKKNDFSEYKKLENYLQRQKRQQTSFSL